ncbi:MAG: phosphotransferase [Magnetococcales bacterium]|nr:phosphotransferase [Magnetococcales bacterium]
MFFSLDGIRAWYTAPFVVELAGADDARTDALLQELADNPGIVTGRLDPQRPGAPLRYWRLRWQTRCECLLLKGPTRNGFLLPRPDALLRLDAGQDAGSDPTLPRLELTGLADERRQDAVWHFLSTLPAFFAKLQPKAGRRARFGAIWFCSQGLHFKFCLTPRAREELARAVNIMGWAATSHLRTCVPTLLAVQPHLLVTPRHAPIHLTRHLPAIVAYFERNRHHCSSQSVTLWEVARAEILETTFATHPDYQTCERILRRHTLQPGFAHRDFHEQNILWDPDRGDIVLVDWGDARTFSCCWFDVLNLMFFRFASCLKISQAEAIGRWWRAGDSLLPGDDPVTTLWERYAKQITPPIVAAYILDYIAVDLNKMTPDQINRKLKKYQTYLALAAQMG